MSEKYRFTIEKIDVDENGSETAETVLLVEGSIGIVRASLSFAPAALGDESTSAPLAPVNATSSYMTPDGPVIGDDKPRRQRRTKAQMEADRAAEQATTEPVAAVNGEETTAPLSTPIAYAPPAAEPTPAPYNPFAPAS